MNYLRKLFAGGKNMNTSIFFLTFNDMFTWGGYNAVLVLIGLFLANRLGEDTVQMVGIGTGILYFTRSVVQIPVGLIGDRTKSDRDDVLLLMLGNLIMGISVALMVFIREEWLYYLLQLCFGVGSAFNLVNYRKLFAKNLDRGREGFEYAVYGTGIAFAIAIFSILSGPIANVNEYYFSLVIFFMGIVMVSSNIWLFPVYFRQKKSG